jgi:glycosyltransferase involved in cell wall biosynthesis
VAASHIAAAVPRGGEVLVVPNGIDPAAWTVTPVRGEPGELRVLAVMRMAPRKRTLPLVKVLGAAARALDGGLRATLVGDGPERRRAEEWVRGNGFADRIRFAGRCDRAGVLSAMAHADVFVQPSIRESFGIAALEARTAGLPVVALRQTGTTEFIHDGVEGLIADDDIGLMRAIVRLGHDRALCASIADHNRAVAPAEAWPSVLVAVEAAYEAARTRVR